MNEDERRPAVPPRTPRRVAASPLPWLAFAGAAIAWAFTVREDASAVAIPLLLALGAVCGGCLAILVARRSDGTTPAGIVRPAVGGGGVRSPAEDPIVVAMSGRRPTSRAAAPRARTRPAAAPTGRERPEATPVSGSGGGVVSRPSATEAPPHRRPNWVRRLEPTIAVEPEPPLVLHDD